MSENEIALGDVTLAASEWGPSGGSLVVLLHGFPETKECWSHIAPILAASGLHVVAIDQRGYARSGKPAGSRAYDLDSLAKDVLNLAGHYGAARFHVVGHDWGAAVGWWLASQQPQALLSLTALSAPHPAVWSWAIGNDPDQRRRSAYVPLMGLHRIPEWIIGLGDYRSLEKALSSSGIDARTLAAYREAWRQPGALSGMINWYRAFLRRRFEARERYRVPVPTVFAYGEEDPDIGQITAYACAELGPDIEIVGLAGRGHWLVSEIPSEVIALIRKAVGRAPG